MSDNDTDYEGVSSAELVETAYDVQDDDQYWSAIVELRRRGGASEFDLAGSLTGSPDALKREIGAQILGQLGWQKDSFHNESVDILISLLSDENPDVIEASTYGLGHRGNTKSIPHLMKLVRHSSSDIRHGVAFALGGHNDEVAVSGLIELSDDSNDEVRNWAIFGLGQQCEMDSPEIREVFIKHLSEDDPEIRGEAMIGLAIRKDERVKPAIVQELEGEFHGTWAVRAAELYPGSEFIDLLVRVRAEQLNEVDDYMIGCIDDAIKACASSVPKAEA